MCTVVLPTGVNPIAVNKYNTDLRVFMIISRSILLIMRKVSDESCNSHNSHFIIDSPVADYETMWKIMVQPDRSHDNIIQRMRFACWITKATDIHT